VMRMRRGLVGFIGSAHRYICCEVGGSVLKRDRYVGVVIK
jgi:hypothetical protein